MLVFTICRYVTGEVSTIVMKQDEETVEARSRLESVELLLQDDRIGQDLKSEIRQHFHASKSSNTVDMAALFRQEAMQQIFSVVR